MFDVRPDGVKVRFIASALAFLMLTASAFGGQGRARIITSPACPDDDEDEIVLEVTGLRIADRQTAFDTKFEAGNDWLANLVFRLRNRTSKPIAGVAIIVGLLEGVDEELPLGASFAYGLQFVRINVVAKKKRRSGLHTLIGPGNKIEITAEGSKPFGLLYMDAILAGKTRASNWMDFAIKAGARFHKAKVRGAIVRFTDGSEADARMVVSGECDKKN